MQGTGTKTYLLITVYVVRDFNSEIWDVIIRSATAKLAIVFMQHNCNQACNSGPRGGVLPRIVTQHVTVIEF